MNYVNTIDRIIDRIRNNNLPKYCSSALGVFKPIALYDDLSSNKSLYDKAYDVEMFYQQMR